MVALAAEQLHGRLQYSLPGGGWRLGNHSFTDGTQSITTCKRRPDPRRSCDGAPSGREPRLPRAVRLLASARRALAVAVGRAADADLAKALDRGAAAAEELIEELAPLTARHDLHGKPAAQGAGKSIAGGARVRDRFLERNQAARFAIEDLQHVVTLLAYLARASETSGNAELAEFCGRWERKLKRLEGEARKAAAALGADLDGASRPAGRVHGRARPRIRSATSPARWARPSTAVPRARASYRSTRGGRFSPNAFTPSRKSSAAEARLPQLHQLASRPPAVARPRGRAARG